MTQPTFYWHDYETWGANPLFDRPAQFAGLRTTLDFEPVGRPLNIYAQPTPDFLPHPRAVLVTGITPQHASLQGMCEAAFAEKIAAEMQAPDTISVGYNNINFDDEVTRHLFYRNFIDPYAHTWQNQTSRWDLIDLVRACYALRPEGIEWPYHDDGRVSLRLEDLSRANQIDHGNAHDALADVHATVELAKKIKAAQPRLFQYSLNLRRKQAAAAQLNFVQFTPLVHISSYYGAVNGYLSIIMPLGYHPEQPNTVIYWDLRYNPADIEAMTEEALIERRFTRRSELAEQGIVPFAGGQFQLNKCPFIAPLNVLDANNQQRWQIDLQQCERYRQLLLSRSDLRERIIQAASYKPDYESLQDPDFMLYSGDFFSDQDKSNMAIIRAATPQQLAGLDLSFEDPRLPEMLFRYRARNYPATLTDSELMRWREFCQQRMLHPPGRMLSAERFMQELESALQDHTDNVNAQRLLHDLYRYVQEL